MEPTQFDQLREGMRINTAKKYPEWQNSAEFMFGQASHLIVKLAIGDAEGKKWARSEIKRHIANGRRSFKKTELPALDEKGEPL